MILYASPIGSPYFSQKPLHWDRFGYIYLDNPESFLKVLILPLFYVKRVLIT